MSDTGTVDFLRYFWERHRRRTLLTVGLLFFAGIAEGISLITLLPILELVTGGEGERSAISETLHSLFGSIGISLTLGPLLILIVVAITVKAYTIWIAMKQVGVTVARVATELRLELLQSLLHARWGYFVSRPVGQLSNAISNEAYRAAVSFKQACLVMAGVVQVCVYVAAAAIVSWRVALLALLAGSLVAMLLRGFIAVSRRAGRQETQLMKSLVGRVADTLNGIKPIRSMGREGHIWPLLQADTRELNRAQERQVVATESLKLAQEPLLVLMLAVGLFVMLRAGTQEFSVVLLTAFIFYRMIGRMHTVQVNYQAMAVGESAFWSLRESIQEAVRERESTPGREAPPELVTGIVFDNVSFSYGEKSVFRDVSLQIPAGHFVSIVGPSGAGKTTLVDLIIGLQTPESGEILFDGRPATDFDVIRWRNRIGYVPQEMFLFHDTVLQNVTLGNPDLTRADAEKALRAAGAWDFISALPQGLDTVVGERGTKLSGGQRQRIALARALVVEPRLLILDEVTTSLDRATEAVIAESLSRLKGRVTILSISHQPTLRELSDAEYRVQDGSARPYNESVGVVA